MTAAAGRGATVALPTGATIFGANFFVVSVFAFVALFAAVWAGAASRAGAAAGFGRAEVVAVVPFDLLVVTDDAALAAAWPLLVCAVTGDFDVAGFVGAAACFVPASFAETPDFLALVAVAFFVAAFTVAVFGAPDAAFPDADAFSTPAAAPAVFFVVSRPAAVLVAA